MTWGYPTQNQSKKYPPEVSRWGLSTVQTSMGIYRISGFHSKIPCACQYGVETCEKSEKFGENLNLS